jgi:hypothetical protein
MFLFRRDLKEKVNVLAHIEWSLSGNSKQRFGGAQRQVLSFTHHFSGHQLEIRPYEVQLAAIAAPHAQVCSLLRQPFSEACGACIGLGVLSQICAPKHTVLENARPRTGVARVFISGHDVPGS